MFRVFYYFRLLISAAAKHRGHHRSFSPAVDSKRYDATDGQPMRPFVLFRCEMRVRCKLRTPRSYYYRYIVYNNILYIFDEQSVRKKDNTPI